MSEQAYDVDILVQGFPGKSVCHGGLGWSTIALLRGRGRIALVDTGPFGMRGILQERLKARGLGPADITDVLLTHSHFDHSVNWTLFRNARIVIGAAELAWSLKQPWGETYVPELYMRELARWPTLVRANDGDEVMPGITAHLATGHTPGCLVFVAHDKERDIVFTGDAAKNRAELVSRSADMTDQIALNVLVYDRGFSHEPLPSRCNWPVHHATPAWDEERRLFVEPAMPHEPLGILHMTIYTKRLAALDVREINGPQAGQVRMRSLRWPGRTAI